MSIKSLRTSTNNHQYVDSDVVSRTKLIHTNRGWMSSTTKTLEMGLMAGAALVASGAAMITSANADTVSAAASSATNTATTQKASDSLNTAQSVTAKAGSTANVVDAQTKAPVSNATTTAANTVTNNSASTTNDKAAATNSTQSATTAQNNTSAQKQDAAKPATQASSQKQDAAKSSSEAKPATQASSQKQDVTKSSSEAKPATATQASSQKQDETKSSSEAVTKSDDTKSSNEVKDSKDTSASSNNEVSTPVENTKEAEATNTASNSFENKVSNTVASSDKSENDVAEVEGKQLPELTPEQAQLNNTIDAIQNSTYYTDEQKKALEELIKSGKTDDVDNLPTNLMVNNDGKTQLFVSPSHAIYTNFSAVTDADNTQGTAGETMNGKIVNWGNHAVLPGDDKVYTNKMGIDVDGQTWNAWCLQPMAPGPFYGNNDSSCDASIMQYNTKDILAKNAALIGCAWYGAGGPAAIVNNDGDGNLYTHIAMSVVAWDENFDNLRDYESSHHELDQATVDKWRNIPQVKAILDKAYTFNANTMNDYQDKQWSFVAYSAHKKNSTGTQDLFSVQWKSVPKPHSSLNVSSKGSSEGKNAHVIVKDTVNLSGQNLGGSKFTVTNSLVNKSNGQVIYTGSQDVTTDNNGNASVNFQTEVNAITQGTNFFWETEVKGTAASDSKAYDVKYNFDGKTDSENVTATVIHPSVNVSSQIGAVTRGAETTISDAVKVDYTNWGGNNNTNDPSDIIVTNTLIDKDTGKAVWSGSQTKSVAGNGTLNLVFNASPIETSANKSGYYWETEVKGTAQDQNVDTKSNFDGKDGNEYKPTPKVDVQTKLLSSDGQKQLKIGENVQLTDTVSVGNNSTGVLNPNETYQISGSIIDKNTGKAVATSSASVKGSDIMSGNAKVVFTIPETISMQGHTLYANETVKDSKGTILEGGTEDGSNNDAQQVTVPTENIKTTVENKTAGDPNNGKQQSNVGVTTIVDHVQYNDLVVGQTYTISGTLTDKATGKPMQVDGKDVTSSVTFKATQSNGVADVTFTIDDSALQGHTYVAFETLREDNKEIAVHNDINDKAETGSINSSSIGTTAKNTTENDIGGQTADIGDNIKITDTVSYTNLIPGQTYTIEGTLMDKNTGKAMEVNGKTITASATFKPTQANGTQDVVFTLPNNHQLQGHAAVAFETLKDQNGVVVATHNDINAQSQTVTFNQAKVGTDANNTTKNDVGGKIMDQGQQMVITDTVNYSNLVKGQQYELDGVLMDKQTGKPVTVDGKEITAKATFTATGQNGQTQVVFTLPDDYSLQNHDLVAFETLKQNGDTLYVHADINDKSQTVHVELPWIKTTLTDTTKNDQVTGDNKSVPVGENITLTDTVQYHGLVKGQTYVMNGTLMDKNTGKAVQVNGKDVTASTIFTATGQDGTTQVVFTLPDNINIQGDTLVAFESLNGQNGKVIATHQDINDKGQSVTNKIVSIQTELTDNTGEQTKGSHVVPVGDGISLIDHVKYTGLQPGEQYTMTGTLMDKETGKAVQVNGKDLTETVAFIPTSTDGEVAIHFLLPDDIALQGHELVAFETLKTAGDQKVVANHANWFDQKQTVKVGTPDLHTLATGENQSHNVVAGKDTVIVDQVQYHNLVPGQKYTVKGVLMDKQTGKAVMNNGKPVTAQVTFIPTTPNGTVSLTFKFDGTAYAGHQLVAFEDIYDEHGRLIERHEDINDLAETVNMIKPTPKKETPQVGAATPATAPVSTPATPVAKAAEIKPVVVEQGKPAVQVGAAVAPGLPQTGDSSNEKGLIALAAAGLIGMIGIASIKSKKED